MHPTIREGASSSNVIEAIPREGANSSRILRLILQDAAHLASRRATAKQVQIGPAPPEALFQCGGSQNSTFPCAGSYGSCLSAKTIRRLAARIAVVSVSDERPIATQESRESPEELGNEEGGGKNFIDREFVCGCGVTQSDREFDEECAEIDIVGLRVSCLSPIWPCGMPS
jgi:hypothetical protein